MTWSDLCVASSTKLHCIFSSTLYTLRCKFEEKLVIRMPAILYDLTVFQYKFLYME